MILEIATLDVQAGKVKEFESAFSKAQKIIVSMPGYVSHQLQRGIEKPNRFVLLVNWERLEDHTQGFRQSEQYLEWKAMLHPFYDPFPEVEHYSVVFSNILFVLGILAFRVHDISWRARRKIAALVTLQQGFSTQLSAR